MNRSSPGMSANSPTRWKCSKRLTANWRCQPEYYYSYFTEDFSFACPFSGSFTVRPSDAEESYSFTDCAFTNGFAITGTGSFDYGSSIFTLETEVSGAKSGALTYVNDYSTGAISVTGEYGGETIDLSQ